MEAKTSTLRQFDSFQPVLKFIRCTIYTFLGRDSYTVCCYRCCWWCCCCYFDAWNPPQKVIHTAVVHRRQTFSFLFRFWKTACKTFSAEVIINNIAAVEIILFEQLQIQFCGPCLLLTNRVLCIFLSHFDAMREMKKKTGVKWVKSRSGSVIKQFERVKVFSRIGKFLYMALNMLKVPLSHLSISRSAS